MSILSILENYMITESLGIVYHATDLESAVNIVRTGCFYMSNSDRLPGDISTERELSNNKKYYFSTMRSSSPFLFLRGQHIAEDNIVTFELDYDYLRRKFKSYAVNYGYEDMDDWSEDMESEERFVSDTVKKICDIENFVNVIHIYTSDDYDEEYYIDFGKMIEQSNMKVLFYITTQSYVVRKKGMTLDEYTSYVNEE